MPDPLLPQYTFAPYVRRGVGAQITESDRLGSAGAGAEERARLAVTLELDYTPKQAGAQVVAPLIDREVQLIGPGEIVGLSSEAILRRVPAAGSKSFPSNGLAYVDFFEEDLPWRYTPARPARSDEAADAQHKLRPWMTLLVLDEREYTLDEGARPLPILEIGAPHQNTALAREDETWAWAHVQINEHLAVAGDVPGAIAARPERALSRIVSPRRLAARARYGAFLVPTFETGRLAGLGSARAGVDAQAPAWRAGAMPHSVKHPNRFPVYAHWRFETGENGDFESLVRQIEPGPAGPEFGRRPVDASRPGFGLDGVAPAVPIEIEGALRPPSFVRTAFPASPGLPFAEALERIVDFTEDLGRAGATYPPHPFFVAASPDAFPATLPDDPIVTPPAYGATHAGVRRVAEASSDPSLPFATRMQSISTAPLSWLAELNLDPRNRLAAAAGAELVRQRQEDFMARAWAQLDDVEAAQQRMREAELTAAMSQRLFEKHVSSAADDRVLTLTAAMQPRLRLTDRTVSAHFRESQVPAAARSPAFKRASRPARKLVRRLTGSRSLDGIQGNLIARMNGEGSLALLTSAPVLPEPSAAVELAEVSDAASAAFVALAAIERPERLLFMDIVVGVLQSRRSRPPPQNPLDLVEFKNALKSALYSRISLSETGPLGDQRTAVDALIDKVLSLASDGVARAIVTIEAGAFVAAFGEDIAGKYARGVTLARENAPPDLEIARMTSAAEILQYSNDLGAFNLALDDREPIPQPPALTASASLARTVRAALSPSLALAARVREVLPAAGAPAPGTQRAFAPVRAHPVFDDPMFEPLRLLSQDYVIPNFADLPPNRMTLLEVNQRFVESFLAGLNYEMARELRWREFPTDLRGTYFSRFFDTDDDLSGGAADDIQPMESWSGGLGSSSGRPGSFIVLVIRGDLLLEYPNTAVFAHRAAFTGPGQPRALAPDLPANILHPAFSGRLDPDIALFGFALDVAAAKGRVDVDPGWFFVLQERPGEVRFGLDDPFDPLPALPLASWNDLNWGHLAASAMHVAVRAQPAALALQAPATDAPAFGRSSADLAAILAQNPVLYARHADELLP